MAWPTRDDVVHNASIYMGIITVVLALIVTIDLALTTTTGWLLG